MRRSAGRAAGTAAQPTSWPWVCATTRRTPARRRRPAASSPNGAAAPNHTVSQSYARANRAALRAISGVGNSTLVRSRITSNGWSASNFAAPRQLDA